MRNCFLSSYISSTHSSIHPSIHRARGIRAFTTLPTVLPHALCFLWLCAATKRRNDDDQQQVSSLCHLAICCCCSHQLQKDQLPVEGILFVWRQWRRRGAGLLSVRVASSWSLRASRGRGARWLRCFDAACESGEKKIIWMGLKFLKEKL